MSIARKIFSSNVTLQPGVATSLYQLMRDSPLHWGYEDTTLTTPSLDSIIGSEAGIVPSATVNIGSDSNVRDAASGSNYKGVTVLAGQNYSLQDFGPAGVVDPNQVWFYRNAGTTMDVVFTGR